MAYKILLLSIVYNDGLRLAVRRLYIILVQVLDFGSQSVTNSGGAAAPGWPMLRNPGKTELINTYDSV